MTPPARPSRLRTARLVLEPLEGRHAGALFPILDDIDVYRYESGDPHPDVASLRARYERTARGPRDPSERWWNWAIVLAQSDRVPGSPIGTIEISIVDDGLLALLGYGLGPRYWGFGYAFEASSAAIAYVREHARAAAIDAYIDPRNARSIALVERLGFSFVRLIENNDVVRGLPADDVQYRLQLTKDE